MGYDTRTGKVPRTNGLFIGPPPETDEEIAEIAEKYNLVVDTRLFVAGITTEAETDGVPWKSIQSLLEARGRIYAACPYPEPSLHAIPVGTAYTASIRKAWEKALNGVIQDKKVLIISGSADKNMSRQGLIAILFLCAFTGWSVDFSYDYLRKAIPRVDVDKKLLGIAKSLIGERRKMGPPPK